MSIMQLASRRTGPVSIPCASPTPKTDADLIALVRKGEIAAYGDLYQRHVASAYNLAWQLGRSKAEVDDLVAEAFAKLLDALRADRGPDSAFRAYLLTAMRHTAYDKTRRDRKLELTDDVSQVSGVRAESVSVVFTDPAVAGFERSLAARAFDRLPQRWQKVLWHTEIEGQAPGEVAALLGLNPNGVSALAYRARKGLCSAYLQAQLENSDVDKLCRQTFELLGAWAYDGLCNQKKKKDLVEAHLDECQSCRTRLRELAETNPTLVLRCA